MESSIGPSSDTTCPIVDVEVLCAPGAGEYPGDSQGDSKGSAGPCAVIEILGGPGAEFKVSNIFLACWLYSLRYWSR